MVARLDKAKLIARQEVVAPPAPRAWEDRSFELPPILHIATAALFIGFVTVLSLAFAHPQLAVPYGVFVAFIVAFFAVPGIWARMKPDESRTRALGWYEFMDKGIATATGRAGGVEASVLVLLLPFLILCWAVAVAIINAAVS